MNVSIFLKISSVKLWSARALRRMGVFENFKRSTVVLWPHELRRNHFVLQHCIYAPLRHHHQYWRGKKIMYFQMSPYKHHLQVPCMLKKYANADILQSAKQPTPGPPDFSCSAWNVFTRVCWLYSDDEALAGDWVCGCTLPRWCLFFSLLYVTPEGFEPSRHEGGSPGGTLARFLARYRSTNCLLCRDLGCTIQTNDPRSVLGYVTTPI